MCPPSRWPSARILPARKPVEASLRLRTHPSHPFTGAVLQLGVIFVFPDGFISREHSQEVPPFYFPPGQLRKESAAAPCADDLVDLADQIIGQYDVCSSSCHRCPTSV